MSSRCRGWWMGLLPGLILLSCSDDDRPPPVSSCSGDDCGPEPGGIAPSTGGETGSGGENGGGGEEEPTTLTGSVVQFSEDQFLQATAFPGPGTLLAFGVSDIPAQGSFEGGSFVLDEVEPGATLWALASPASGALHFDTWSLLSARSDFEVTVPVVARSVIEDILSVLTIPAVPLDGTAQVVLRITSPTGGGLEGVIVSAPAAQLVIYASSGTWSETEPQTDLSGLVVLGNVTASEVPGNDMIVTLGGALSGQFQVRVSNDALTFVALQARADGEEEEEEAGP